MSVFTDAEIEFVNSQRLGRLATVGADGMPHVVPVGVFYDPDADALVIGADAEFGEAVMTSSKKFRDAQRRPKAAVVLDDLRPRILEVRGQVLHVHARTKDCLATAEPSVHGSARVVCAAHPVVCIELNGQVG